MQNNKSYGSYGAGSSAGNDIMMLFAGIGIGAALMYILDPDRRRSRRARLSDQLASQVNRLGDAAQSKARDLRNRAQGAIHEASSMLTGAGNTGQNQTGVNNSEANSATTTGARSQAAGQKA